MKMAVWIVGLIMFLFGSSALAAGDSNGKRSTNKKKSSQCVQPAPKYGGQDKSNNGHGNNEDDVDRSNPGKKKVEDSDPDVDDEKKTGK